MSSPITLQAAFVSTASRRTGWIISPLWDSVFFLGPPLLALAAIAAFDLSQFNSAQLQLMLLAVVAGGHHIPGFIRAYSDPELMRRYRGRMVLAPVLLIAAALICEFRQIPGMQLIMIFWGVWHIVMQNYGLLRIYGAKTGDASGATVILDWLALITCISAVYLNNSSWSHRMQWYVYELGFPILPSNAFSILSGLSLMVAIIVMFVYVFASARRVRNGQPISLLKYVLLVENVLFFVLAFNLTNSILMVTVIVELVHDLQYYAIGWVFQLRLAEKRGADWPVLRRLFRPTPQMLLGYLALCLTYGVLISDYGRTYLYPDGILFQTTRALSTAAVIFHFYSDGFIWKVRQPRVREYLGICESQGKLPRAALLEPPVWKRSLLHFTCYATILSLIFWTHATRSNRAFEVALQLAREFPELGAAHHTLGLEYQRRDQHASAIRELLTALQLGVDEPIELRQRLAISFEAIGQYARAVDFLQKAVAMAPATKLPQVAAQLALLLAECPDRSIRQGSEAVRLAEMAVPIHGSKRPLYLDILATSYQSAGRLDEARNTEQQALDEARRLGQNLLIPRISDRLEQLVRSLREKSDASSHTSDR